MASLNMKRQVNQSVVIGFYTIILNSSERIGLVGIVFSSPVAVFQSIKPRLPLQLVPTGFLSHHTSPSIMNCKLDTPATRKPKLTHIPGFEVLFCVLGISIHRE